MVRPLRIQFPGAVYHVFARGNEQQTIFVDDDDCSCFLETLHDTCLRHRFVCYAYCLMGNHYHLAIETPEGNLSRGMHQLNTVYSQAFNRRHDRSGHLLQGRYGGKLIQKDAYLLAVCRYIVLNPVDAGLVRRPEDWPWSSYRSTIGMTSSPDFLSTDWILDQFAPLERQEAVCSFVEFVRDGMNSRDDLRVKLAGKIIVGDRDFVVRFASELDSRASDREFSKDERFAARPSLDELFEGTCGKRDRNERIVDACLNHGYSMAEVSRFLGVHYITVHRALKSRSRMLKCRT